MPEGVQRFTDFSCGENTMMMSDQSNNIYKTGWRIDYEPTLIQASKDLEVKKFFCGNSYYCMIDKDEKIYQWGNLFKNSSTQKNDNDMLLVNQDFFDGKEIIKISAKFKAAGALVK